MLVVVQESGPEVFAPLVTPSLVAIEAQLHLSSQGALKVTDGPKVTERAQNADFRRKPQVFADSLPLLEIQAFGGHRKPQIFARNRRFSQKIAGNRRLGSVTSGAPPLPQERFSADGA